MQPNRQQRSNSKYDLNQFVYILDVFSALSEYFREVCSDFFLSSSTDKQKTEEKTGKSR